jgi:hypothetical protein
MGRKREIPPAPKRVRFIVKAREDVEPALFERLKELEQSYERGHPESLLHAVDYVLRHYLSVDSPVGWVRETYAQRLMAWDRYEVVDLDEAFGVKRSHKNIAATRERKSLTWRIISDIVEVRRLGKSRDEALEEVADRCKLSLSSVRKIYDDHPRTRSHIERLPTVQFKYPDLPEQPERPEQPESSEPSEPLKLPKPTKSSKRLTRARPRTRSKRARPRTQPKRARSKK